MVDYFAERTQTAPPIHIHDHILHIELLLLALLLRRTHLSRESSIADLQPSNSTNAHIKKAQKYDGDREAHEKRYMTVSRKIRRI